MNSTQNPSLKGYAQDLRRNMTKEERKLWYECLKKLPVTIHRQKVFGKYILDFYCAYARIAIELDGSQHFDKDGRCKDEERDKFLQAKEIKVLRYSNRDINQHFQSVCEDIMQHLGI